MRKRKSVFGKVFKFLLLFVLAIVALLYITGNQYILRGVQLTYMKGRNTAGIYDYPDFDNRTVLAGNPLPWQVHENYNKTPLTDTLRAELENYETDAFLVIKDGKIWLEEYWNNRKTTDISNSFSMAKTMITLLMFRAIENGDIQSLEQPVTDFLPEYKDDAFAPKCTVGDLSAMTSGFDWKEDYYLPLNPTAKAYFGKDIEQQMLSRKFIKEAGGHFEYLSGNTQLLAIILERATGKNLSTQLSDAFWKPLGMEKDALWSLDGSGDMEKAYCCVNATAHDYAKFGQLFLQHGHWNGNQLLDSAHIAKMVLPNKKAFNPDETPVYSYSVWMDYSHKPAFYAMLGHLGQRVIVVPEKDLVIVRLGKVKDVRVLQNRPLEKTATDAYYFVDEVVKMVE